MAVIDEILGLFKDRVRESAVENVPFSLRDCVGTSLKMLRVQARAKELEIRCHFGVDVPDGVIGDPVRFMQVINNLVGNARPSSPSRGRFPTTVAGPREKGRAAVAVSVRDTGAGIESGKQEMIFDGFSQADMFSHAASRRYGAGPGNLGETG